MNTSSENKSSDSLPHMDALFAMAQVLTLDAGKAEQLLETTYRRAIETAGQHMPILENRRHMMQLLVRIHQEQSAPATDVPAPPEQSVGQSGLKQRILDQFLRDSAPVAFATLADADRVLLTLCDVENMSCADASLILGAAPDATCARLEEARKAFEKVMIANASPAESQLLQQLSASDWVGSALRKALSSEFTASPPTLEPRLKTALVPARTSITAPSQRLTATPSADRKPTATANRNRRLSRGLTTLLLILIAGMVGYIGSSLIRTTPDSNLLTLSVKKASRIETILQTSDAAAAEKFVRNQMDWRLTLPTISQSTLTGVGISEVAQNVRVPVFLFSDEDEKNDAITVYAYTYALLDKFSDRIALERDILSAISNEDHFDIHDLSDQQKVIIWRNSNDIFMAVTSQDASALQQRIQN